MWWRNICLVPCLIYSYFRKILNTRKQKFWYSKRTQTAFALLINSHFGYFSMNSWRNNGGYFAAVHLFWNDLFYFWKNHIEPWVIWNCRVQINNQITKESWEFHLVTKRTAHAHNEWMDDFANTSWCRLVTLLDEWRRTYSIYYGK